MDITTLAAWGEFIGGIAVVFSLIYLASQIRQNSRLLRISAASASTQTMFTTYTLQAQDPELARAIRSGLVDRSSLSEADRARFDPLMLCQFAGNLQHYEFAREGLDFPLATERHERGMRHQMQQPGIQDWWREWRQIYPQEFCEYVDGLIREGEAAG